MSSSGRLGALSPLYSGYSAVNHHLKPHPLSERELDLVARCIESGYSIRVCEHYHIEGSSSSRWFFANFFLKDSDRRLAEIFSRSVISRQMRSIKDNSVDLTLEVAKRFAKSGPLSASDPFVIRLKREIQAARLSISSAVFDANPGFEEFATRSHLHRLLLKKGHTLQVDARDKLSIMCDGVYLPWEEAAQKIHYQQDKWTGHYSAKGIQEACRYDWSILAPTDSGNPADWGNQYAVKIIIWYAQTPSLTGEPATSTSGPSLTGVHTYLHLLTPDEENNIISVGFYRPDKHGARDLAFPLRVRKGSLQHPDESDEWGGRFETLTVAVTHEQFEAMKRKIEQDKAADNLPYHIGNGNCNEYTLDVVRLAGLKIPSFLPISDLLPVSLPSTVINTIGAVFGGSTRVDPDAPNVSAHIGSFADLVDDSKAQFSHPHVLEHAFRKIEAWRMSQMQLSQYEYIRFAVPIEYKT